jgi:hypothetical protein
MRHPLLWTAAVCVLCGACQGPPDRLNAPPHGLTEDTSPMRDMYEHMVDNEVLADMTISDIHFLPHRARLNRLGEERLGRLAGLMELYGGTIRFNTSVTDETLLQQRTEAIMAFLDEEGIDTTAEVLVRDLPGGRGMDAVQAIKIKVKSEKDQPKDKDGDTSSGLFGREANK